MLLKLLFLLSIVVKFNSIEFLDTDCYRNAGVSVDECKKFTTFVNGTDDNFYIEPNVLYLCCYVDDIVEGNNYKGCLPIKEEVVFGDNKEFKFDCFSYFFKLSKILIIITLINIFL